MAKIYNIRYEVLRYAFVLEENREFPVPALIPPPYHFVRSPKRFSKQSVLDHLICSGFRPEYLKWVYHGEGTTVASTNTTLNKEMHDLLNDAFQPEGGIGVETSLKAIESDSTSTVADRDDFTKDSYSKVKGPEKRGYVRLVGRMPTTKGKGDSPSDSNIIHQLQSAVNVMMNIIHEHIPSANLSTVLSDMNIQFLAKGIYSLRSMPSAGYQAINLSARLKTWLQGHLLDILVHMTTKVQAGHVMNLAAESPAKLQATDQANRSRNNHFLYI
ncbi:hypothetical protein E3N88_26643 [Mikania micrantha]|uniref:Uncharacterized protein n=1 Tax=Mikania micrantha TaxID=192012 RepID=A0A5N6MXE7_9ASTR|nr:hypothetical protein E3N88_26643 [Mikania micrantha]